MPQFNEYSWSFSCLKFLVLFVVFIIISNYFPSFIIQNQIRFSNFSIAIIF